jgi:hypothetical protein
MNTFKAVTERGVNLRVVFTKKFSRKGGHSPIDMKLLAPRRVQVKKCRYNISFKASMLSSVNDFASEK